MSSRDRGSGSKSVSPQKVTMPGKDERLQLSRQMYDRRKGYDTSKPSRTESLQYQAMLQSAQEKLAVRRSSAPSSPVVGVSHRPGHGYDLHALQSSLGTRIHTTSSPPELSATKPKDSRSVVRRNEQESVQARRELLQGYDPVKKRLPPNLVKHLEGVDGLYIPGGQDILSDVKDARESRLAYEAAALDVARQRGIPVLAICGGSRRLAAAYGVPEVDLTEYGEGIHNKRGTAEMAHGLSFPNPHSVLGGAKSGTGRMTSVDSINSTHSKVVGVERERVVFPWSTPELTNVERVDVLHHNPVLFGSGMQRFEKRSVPLLEVTALEPTHRTPEGFETAFGAPHIGVTSHPEAIAGGSGKAVSAASGQAKTWSHHVMDSFQQSVQTYQRRRLVNAQIRGDMGPQDEGDVRAMSIMAHHNRKV